MTDEVAAAAAPATSDVADTPLPSLVSDSPEAAACPLVTCPVDTSPALAPLWASRSCTRPGLSNPRATDTGIPPHPDSRKPRPRTSGDPGEPPANLVVA